MSLYEYAKEHITEQGGIRTPFFDTEPTRVTMFSRFENGKGKNIEEVR